jgi:hypothetical protein
MKSRGFSCILPLTNSRCLLLCIRDKGRPFPQTIDAAEGSAESTLFASVRLVCSTLACGFPRSRTSLKTPDVPDLGLDRFLAPTRSFVKSSLPKSATYRSKIASQSDDSETMMDSRGRRDLSRPSAPPGRERSQNQPDAGVVVPLACLSSGLSGVTLPSSVGVQSRYKASFDMSHFESAMFRIIHRKEVSGAMRHRVPAQHEATPGPIERCDAAVRRWH